ncbi:MAG: hypothetical protein PVJ64_10965 [Gemmatimonadales bacterium]|jgi:hypothetical protein
MTFAACHHYVPVSVDRLERPDRVRVHLSVAGSYELLDLTAADVTQIEGEVVRWDEASLVLSAWWLVARSGLEFRGQGETVVVQREHIAAIEERRISAWKTVALVGGGAAVMAIGVGSLGAVGSSGSSNGTDPGK